MNKKYNFEHSRKVKTVKDICNNTIKKYVALPAFSELPSISIFLYYVKMHCPIDF